jgi:hypothetical protein
MKTKLSMWKNPVTQSVASIYQYNKTSIYKIDVPLEVLIEKIILF